MKRTCSISTACLTAVTLAALSLPATAEVTTNPYESIVERNPFALKPPPPPAPPEDPSTKTAPPPTATVELTGITSVLSSKCALFEIVPGPGKPMIKPILKEGERVESVEVVSINIEKNEVTIKNGSVVTNLTFKVAKSTDKPAGAPPAGGVPPAPIPGMTPGGVPGGINAAGNAAAAGGQNAFGNNEQFNGGGRGGVMVGGGASPTGDGFRSIPPRNVRGVGQPVQPQMTAEESVFDIERNRIINQQVQQQTGIKFPPLPPTPLNPNPQDGGIDQGGQPQNPGSPISRIRRPPTLPPFPGQQLPPLPGQQ